SAPAGSVQVKAGQQAKLDLVLALPLELPSREKRMTDDDYAKLLPESDSKSSDTRNAALAGIRELVVSDCKECHTLQWVVAARKTHEQWQDAMERMYNDLLGRRQPLWFAIKDDEFAGGHRKAMMVDYLAKNFGPGAPPNPRVLAEMLPAPGGPAHPNRN